MEKQKNQPIQLDFFLGTESSLGFQNHFETLRKESGLELILLKGAFGCGTSALLMNLLAEMQEQGKQGVIERIHAPQEPTRLVGVVCHGEVCDVRGQNVAELSVQENHFTSLDCIEDIEQVGCVSQVKCIADKDAAAQSDAILNSDAPQNFDAVTPGVGEQIVSLHDAIYPQMLQPHAAEIKALLARINCLQNRAARYIASVSALLFDSRRAATCATDFAKIQQYAARLCARELPPLPKQGSEKVRFLSAITPQGNLCYAGTVASLAQRVVVFHDEYGAASKAILDIIRTEAIARGYDIITCPCALFPDEKIEHIIVPSIGLAFVTSNAWHEMQFEGQQNIHCNRFCDAPALKSCRTRLRFNLKAAKDLQAQCCDLLAQIEACYTDLRDIYRPALDAEWMQQRVREVWRE